MGQPAGDPQDPLAGDIFQGRGHRGRAGRSRWIGRGAGGVGRRGERVGHGHRLAGGPAGGRVRVVVGVAPVVGEPPLLLADLVGRERAHLPVHQVHLGPGLAVGPELYVEIQVDE